MPSRTLLVVDQSSSDRAAWLRLAERLPPEASVQPIEAATLQEAVAQIERALPGAILTDSILPDGTALDLLRAVTDSAGRTRCPVIVCAAAGTPEEVVAALHAGAQDFVLKTEADRRLLGALQTARTLGTQSQQSGDPAAEMSRLYQAARTEIAGLRAVNAAKDDFLAMLSHELRTPLAPVLSLVTSSLSDSNLTPDLRETFAMIQRNVELAARLIDDLLDLTQIASGRMKIEKKVPVDIHHCIEAALDVCYANFEQKRISVRSELSATRPFVLGEFARLNQVLWNLFNNAAKFTKPNGHVTISSTNLDGHVAIDIRDDGMGIDPGKLESLFGPGPVRLHPTGTGIGLGLAITRAIVEGHGGQIRAESEGRDKGAVFRLLLPCATSAPPSAQAAAAPLSTAVRGKTILVVEDHEDMRRALSRALRRKGFGVTMAGSLSAAEQQFTSTGADLVVCDIGLPDGTGWELMEKLRAHGPVRAIAVSGFGMDHDLAKSKKAGFVAHLTKPIDFPRLESLIVEHLARPPQ